VHLGSLPERLGSARCSRPLLTAQRESSAHGTAAGIQGVNPGADQVEVQAPKPPLHLRASEATGTVEAAVALCLPAVGVKEPARSQHRRRSGQKSATGEMGLCLFKYSWSRKYEPGCGKKRERRAGGVRFRALRVVGGSDLFWGVRRVPGEVSPGRGPGCPPGEWPPELGKMLHLPLPRSGRTVNFPRR
jgi:hypothetical protein